MKQFKQINQVLEVERLESVDGSVSLHVDQIELLNQALEGPHSKVQKKISKIEARTSEIKAETARIKDEKESFSVVLNKIHPLVKAQPTIEKKMEAVRALLAAKPGVELDEKLNDKQLKSNEEYLLAKDLQAVDWNKIDSLEHNKAVDKKLGG